MLSVILALTMVSSEPQFESEKTWRSSFSTAISGTGAFGGMLLETVVDRDGKPVQCRIAKSKSGPSFESRVCAVAMRSHYKPARDQSGDAIAGVLRYSIASGGYEAEMATAMIDAVLAVDSIPAGNKSHVSSRNVIDGSTGRVESCTASAISNSPALDRAACAYLMGSSFPPVLDSSGTAVRAYRSSRIAFIVSPPADK